jgi:hypothetical protein
MKVNMPSSGHKKKLLVFLSHAKEDKAKVKKLCMQLREDGFDPWLDEERLLPGHDWGLEIEKAQRISDVILLCFSNRSISKSGYVQREFKQAMEIGKEKPEGVIFVIPVRLDKCDVPFFIQKIQWVDYPAHYERLLLSLKKKITNKPLGRRSKVKRIAYQINTKISRTIEADIVSPIHPISYRQEILAEFFRLIKQGESFYILGGPGFGKKRLFDFVVRRDVISHYLGKSAENTWIVKVNPYLLETIKNVWAFYELLFRSLLLELNTHNDTSSLVTQVIELDAQVISGRDDLLASRFFGLCISRLCHEYDKKIYFLFDEFDESYRNLPRELFSELRAIREENRGKLSFIFSLRHNPEQLRSPIDIWAMYELFSQNVIGVGPYSMDDSFVFLHQLEARYDYTLDVDANKIHIASGGHAGLIVAIYKVFMNDQIANSECSKPSWLAWLSKQQGILAECENLMASLDDDEKHTLLLISRNEINKTSILITRNLALKGLLQMEDNKLIIFSPLLSNYISSLES